MKWFVNGSLKLTFFFSFLKVFIINPHPPQKKKEEDERNGCLSVLEIEKLLIISTRSSFSAA